MQFGCSINSSHLHLSKTVQDIYVPKFYPQILLCYFKSVLKLDY